MQDSFGPALDALTALLGFCMTSQSGGGLEMGDDGFAPIRTSGVRSSEGASSRTANTSLARLAMTILAVVPSFQSLSGQSARSHDPVDKLLMGKHSEGFFDCVSTLYNLVGRGVLQLMSKDLARLFDECLEQASDFNLTLKDDIFLPILQAILSTIDLWLQSSYQSYRDHVLQVLRHVTQKIDAGFFHSWKLRDVLLRIVDEVVRKDVERIVIDLPLRSDEKSMLVDGVPEPLSDWAMVLMQAMRDEDIRIRLRAAPANARLFQADHIVRASEPSFYVEWKDQVPADLRM
jgi:hypothetical protein